MDGASWAVDDGGSGDVAISRASPNAISQSTISRPQGKGALEVASRGHCFSFSSKWDEDKALGRAQGGGRWMRDYPKRAAGD